MLSVQAAEAKIMQLVQPLAPQDCETVSLLEAYGRVLARDISSPLDFPYWDNSSMDGYAVRVEDLEQCSAENPVTLQIAMKIPAGHSPADRLMPGQAARLFTGSMLPEGATAVVMQEQTQLQDGSVTFTDCPQPGAWIRRQGDYYRANDSLLKQGTVLSGPDIAVLATAQCSEVSVYRRPRVVLLSTGNELISPHQSLQPGQIIDSNQPLLTVLVQQAGMTALPMGIISDERATLKAAVAAAISQADVVISSGGVSVGDYDYVKEIIAELGGTIHVQSVAIKPGKPLTVATFNGADAPNAPDASASRPVLYFGLPGNPVSTPAVFWRFVEPALKKLSGVSCSWGPTFVRAKAQQNLKSDGKRETYVWGQLSISLEGFFEFNLAGGAQNSANLINLAQTNAFAVLTQDCPSIAAGDWVTVMQVGPARTPSSQSLS